MVKKNYRVKVGGSSDDRREYVNKHGPVDLAGKRQLESDGLYRSFGTNKNKAEKCAREINSFYKEHDVDKETEVETYFRKQKSNCGCKPITKKKSSVKKSGKSISSRKK